MQILIKYEYLLMVEGKMCICWCPYVDICASNEEPFADWCLKWRKMTAEWSYNNVTSFTHHLLHTLPSLTVTWLCNYQHAPMTLQSSDLLQISPKLIREPALCLAYLCSGLWFVNWMLQSGITLITWSEQWLMCSDQYCYHRGGRCRDMIIVWFQ